MFKKMSLRWRITLLTSLLIALCCTGLSLMLNRSAYRMVDALKIQPSMPVGSAAAPARPAGVVQLAKSGYLSESLAFTAIAVVVGGFLTYCVSGKALEPIQTLSEQVKNTNTNNLNQPLPVPQTNDQLAELTVSFNEMTAKLDQAFTMQKRFSADAAHELRTPLAALQTKLDVFQKKEQHTPEEYKALTDVFQKQLGRLRSLVTELLEIANLEHEFQMEEIGLSLLLEDTVSELMPVAGEKGVSLTLETGDFSVCGEYDLLYRVVFNLMENAIKYNLPGGTAAVCAVEDGKNAVITVKDTGIGIPDPMKQQIFEPFCRVDKSRSREMGGAGLGLALVESIVNKHGGTIAVTDNEGGGSCFTVTLPMK